jgi:hypothetical protein
LKSRPSRISPPWVEEDGFLYGRAYGVLILSSVTGLNRHDEKTGIRQYQLSVQMPTESDDRFDQALAEWFARHQVGWSGTASELLAAVESIANASNDLWPQPVRALYGHLETHRESLHSLGVDVLLYPGFPRMVSLRTCQEEKPPGNSPSNGHATSSIFDLTKNFRPSADTRTIHAVTDAVSPAGHSVPSSATGVVESVTAEPAASTDDKHAGRAHCGGLAFGDTTKALFGIVEMRDQIKEQGLDLQARMHLVANRTQAITGSSGVLLGWLQQDTLEYPAQVGIAATLAGQPCQAHPVHSCISQGLVLPLPDAQIDPVVGASCRRGSIKSLIVAPIFQDRKVAGAIELLFNETRSFSTGDVMILELITDLVSEQITGVGHESPPLPPARESTPRLRITENIESLDEKADADETRAGRSQGANAGETLEVFANCGSNITVDLAAPVSASASRKRVWTRLP